MKKDYIDKLINEEIYLDMQESFPKDIHILSEVIDERYPGISVRLSPRYYYPTLESFYERFGEGDCVCFYNRQSKTWDGWKEYKHSHAPMSKILSAGTILDNSKSTVEINEDELMFIFAN